ncbi:hypothetical protein B6K86_02875 [Lachnospiraceae bacterium]|nr:hypothetical protein B6K86_02875 [Lachnospiraceae bacterium]
MKGFPAMLTEVSKRPVRLLLCSILLVFLSSCVAKDNTQALPDAANTPGDRPSQLIAVDAPGEAQSPSSPPDGDFLSPQEAKPAPSAETEATGTVSVIRAAGESEGKSEQEAFSSSDSDGTIRLAFCGDILLSDHVLSAYDRAGNAGGILDDVLLQAGRDADLFIANEEFPFGTGGVPAPNKQFTFRVPPERSAIFKELGIDLVTLANNHSLDYGRSCLQETFDALDRVSIDYIGAGSNLSRAMERKTYCIKGKTIGFLAASRVIPEFSWNASKDQSGLFTTYDPTALIEEIRRAEDTCDFTVVYLHWGLERHTEPEAYQIELAKQYIDAGADLVIGAHPHVLQPVQTYRNVPIAYSLGNYLFGSSIPETMLLLADLSPDGGLRLSKIPASAVAGKTVSTGEETVLFERP